MPPDRALQQYFGFDAFRPGQAEALAHVLAGRHTLVVMPTGAGKSLIYQLAAMLRPGITLVISPLVALMKDQVDGLERRGLPATFINSSLSAADQSRRLAALAGGAFRMVLVAPERLRSRAFLEALARVHVDLLAVDEAHCVSQWGHDFRPDYLHLAAARRAFGEPTTLALTATATREVQADIVRLLGLPGAEAVITGFNRPNLRLEVQPAATRRAKLEHTRAALAEAGGAAIVYTSTRREAESLAAELRGQAGVPAQHYHGTLDAATRTAVQNAFLSGELPVVVATNAFGMGIDRADVRLVLHYNLPGSLEAYYQEAGRAGRDGQPARALLLYAPQDAGVHERFVEMDAPRPPDVRALHAYAARAGSFTLSEVERDLGLDAVRARVGLQQLEAAGALRRAPGEAGSVRVQALPLTPGALEAVSAQVNDLRAHKLAQLRVMVGYAQSGECRRRLILDHFGDSGPAEAGPGGEAGSPDCCDNCRVAAATATAETRPAATQAEHAALSVLDAVARLRWPLGKRRLARLLQGKPEPNGARVPSPHAGHFAAWRQPEIEALIDQLVERRYLRHAGTERPVLTVTAQGQAALAARAAIPVRLRPVAAAQANGAQPPREAGGTVNVTAQLFAAGRSPDEIAAERGLTLGTIYGHFAELIAQGRVPVEQVVPGGLLAQVRAAIDRAGSATRLAPIRELLPAEVEIDWGLIRCVASDWARQHQPPSPVPAPGAGAQTSPAPPTAAHTPAGPAPTAAPLEALTSPSAAARGLAVVLLGQPGASEHVKPLLDVLANDSVLRVRVQAAQALGRIGDGRARAALERVAGDLDLPAELRAAARTALAQVTRQR